MQTGYISFCDSTAFNIKTSNIKEDILKTIENLSNIKIIQKHFDIFNKNHFKKLNDIPHLVSLKSNGNPYLLFLTKINFINISIFIDKKIQPGYFLPRMIISYFQFHDSLYSNTLFDGEMVKIKDNKWNFIINDIYIHKNTNLSSQNIFNRIDIIYNILNNEINIDTCDNICNFSIKKYFKYEDMKYMVEDYKPKLNYTCRGIYFNPLYFKFKRILYNFDDGLINSVKRVKYQKNNEFLSSTNNIIQSKIPTSNKRSKMPILSKQNSIIDKSNNLTEKTQAATHVIKEFYIEQTDMVDVFNLYDIYSNKKIDIAYVPNIKTCHFLKNIFKDVTIITKLKIKCKLINKNNKDKWCPYELI